MQCYDYQVISKQSALFSSSEFFPNTRKINHIDMLVGLNIRIWLMKEEYKFKLSSINRMWHHKH